MKMLNKTATDIFCRIIEAMNGKQHLKIINEPFMPLTIERIGEPIPTPHGVGIPYSLCHYYEQNGDLMQDPEMCFVVVDTPTTDPTGSQLVSIIPCMFQQANMGIYQESMTIENNTLITCDTKLQAEHTYFANQWLANIKGQGFLKHNDDGNTVQFSD